MANFEATENKAVTAAAPGSSHLFDDAYHYVKENPGKSAVGMVAGVMAVGALTVSRGRIGLTTLKEGLAAVEHNAPGQAERVMAESAAVRAVPAVSAQEAERDIAMLHLGRPTMPSKLIDGLPAGTRHNMLLHGAAISERPEYVMQIQAGLPVRMGTDVAKRLETSISTGDHTAVKATMDEIFGTPSTYAQMYRRYGQ